jgi:TonB family protein
MDELEAQSQLPVAEQAETQPQAQSPQDVQPSFQEVVAPELIGALPVLPVFSQEQLAEEVAESNIKVIWRGGIPAGVLLAGALSLLFNGSMAALIYFAIQGFWIAPAPKHREYGVYVTAPEDIQDGGSAGGVGKSGDPNVIADVKGPSLDNLINEKPSSDLLGPIESGASDFASIESNDKLSVIAVNTGATSRLPGKPKGGGQANGGQTAGGNGATAGAGLGGSGSGSGSGTGEGDDLGVSIDTQVRILDGPKLVIPMAYLTGTVKVDNPPLIRVWVQPNNRVARVELIKSSGDATFDSIVMEHYRRQKYLAATVDGEAVEKYIDVSYEFSGMGKKS